MKSTPLLTLVIIGIAISGCTTRNVNPKFIQFGNEYVNLGDTTNKSNDGSIAILVENYKDNEFCGKHIDSMAMKLAKEKQKYYQSYLIQFYKVSKKTNVANLTANPRDFDRFSTPEDHIYDYYWSSGKLSSKLKFKNGKLIVPKGREIKISEVPQY